MALTASELKRKLLHIAVGGFAFLLRDLTWPQAALMAVGRVRCSTGWCCRGSAGARCGASRSTARDIRSASCSIRCPCSAWCSCSATTSGWRRRSGACSRSATAWPRSSARPWAVRGCPGTRARAGSASPPSSSSATHRRGAPRRLDAAAAARRLGLAVDPRPRWCPLALACALVESMPTTLDDNLTVPLAGACVLPLLAMAEPGLLLGDPGFGAAPGRRPGRQRRDRRPGVEGALHRRPGRRVRDRHRHADHGRARAAPAWP